MDRTRIYAEKLGKKWIVRSHCWGQWWSARDCKKFIAVQKLIDRINKQTSRKVNMKDIDIRHVRT